MKMMKLLLLILTTSLLVVGCKKETFEEPTTMSKDPIFTVSGTVGQDNINVSAGLENAVFTQGTELINGVKRLFGKMSRNDDYVKLEICDGNIGLTTDYLSVFGNGTTFIQPAPEPLLHVTQENLANTDYIQTLSFTVNGTNVGNVLSISDPGIYTICTNIMFTDGSSKSACNEIILGYVDYGFFTIRQLCGIDGSVKVWIEGNTNPIANVTWYVGNTAVSQGEVVTLEGISTGAPISAKVDFVNGISRTHQIVSNPYIQMSYKFIDDIHTFKNQNANQTVIDFKADLKIKLNGITYKNAGTNAGNFEVEDISYFGKNSAGKDVFLIKGNLNCTLINTQTEELVNSSLSISYGYELP